VRSNVVSRRKLDLPLFTRLAADPDSGVRSSVAANKKCPRALLEQLARDPEELVFAPAREQLKRRKP
jgi:hypothetical protein